ncbi:MAG: DUF2218 domain-containing protein [Roseiflexaceae bacterium]
MHAEARIATPKSAIYLTRLCRHFSHKVSAEFDSERAVVRFPFGLCEMQAAPEQLVIQVRADDAASFERMKEVVSRTRRADRCISADSCACAHHCAERRACTNRRFTIG